MRKIAEFFGWKFSKSDDKLQTTESNSERPKSELGTIGIQSIFESFLSSSQFVNSFELNDGIYTIDTNAQFNSNLYDFEPNSIFKIDISNINSESYFQIHQSFKLKEDKIEFFNNIEDHIRNSFNDYLGFNHLLSVDLSINNKLLNINYSYRYFPYITGNMIISTVEKLNIISNSILDLIYRFENILNVKVNYQILFAKSEFDTIQRLNQIESNWDEICDFLLEIRDISNSSNYIKNNRQVIFHVDGIEPLPQEVNYTIPYGRNYGSTKTVHIGTSNIRLTKNFLNLMYLCNEFLYRMESTFDDITVDILLDKNKVTFNFN
jgi:hypothetical protein